jgi:hypothetical protein
MARRLGCSDVGKSRVCALLGPSIGLSLPLKTKILENIGVVVRCSELMSGLTRTKYFLALDSAGFGQGAGGGGTWWGEVPCS